MARTLPVGSIWSQWLLLAAVALFACASIAEITTDGSLGPARNLSGPDFLVTPDLGALKGNNLFHSFSQFNISNGERANFTGPPDVLRVISRVTGGDVSSIDGLLRNSIEGSDFYFINPAGIIFGKNATLDISGASYFSSADRILLGLDGAFDASNPQQSRLTADAPAAFGFVGNDPAAIKVGSLVVLGAGRSVSLVGGDITVNHRADEPGIIADAGRVNLVSVASQGNVPLDFDDETDAALQGFDRLGQISLVRTDAAGAPGTDALPTISTSSPLPRDPPPPGPLSGTPLPDIPVAGTIYIRGGQITLDSAHITSTNRSNTNQPGVAIDIAARDTLLVRADQGLPALVEAVSERDGDSAAIKLSAEQIEIRGSATDTALIVAASRDSGNSAPIRIQSGSLTVADRASITSNSFGSGRGGDIDIHSDTVLVQAETSRAAISSSTFSSGQGGDIHIEADSVTLQENPDLPHEIPVPGQFSPPPLTGLLSEATARFTGNADSGQITINTNSLEIHDGAVISTAVLSGTGDAGDITVNAGTVLVSGQNSTGFSSKISANIGPNSTTVILPTGRGGNITVNADELRLLDGGTISSTTTGEGDAGNIAATASNITITNNGLIATRSNGPGRGGDISVSSNKLVLERNGLLTAEGEGTGDAGSISVTANDSLIAKDGAILSSSRISDGGNLSLQVGHLIDLLDSEISTAVGSGEGSGGNIIIDSDFIVMDSSRIIANAFGGDGGNISITVGTLLRSPDSIISASSALGIDGVVDLEVDNEYVDQPLAPLPKDYGDNQVATHCSRNTQSSATLSRIVFELLPASPDSLQTITSFIRHRGSSIEVTPMIEEALVAVNAGKLSLARNLLVKLTSDPAIDQTITSQTRILGLQSDIALRERKIESALALARQALDSARHADNSALMVESRNYYGNALYTAGETADALAVYVKALELASAMDLLKYVAPLASNAARAAVRLDSFPRSLRFLQQAEESLDQWPDQSATASTRVTLASQGITLLPVSGDTRGKAAALAHRNLLKAITLSKQTEVIRIQASATGRLGEFHAAQGESDKARSYLNQALMLSSRINAPDLIARWNWQLGRIEYDHKRRQTALNHYEAATGAFSSISYALVFGHRGDPGLYSRTIRNIYVEQSSMMLSIAEQQQSSLERNKWLLGLRSVMEDLKRVELEQYFIDSCIADNTSAGQSEIDKQITAGTAIIYPVVLSDRLVLLASFAGGEMQGITVPVDARRLRQSVNNLHRELRPAGNKRRLVKASRKVHDWLIAPLESTLEEKRIDTLVFVPDDFLRLVPFPVLHDSRQFLIERFAIAVNPGLGLSAPDQSGTMEKLLLFGLTESSGGFPPLPYVATELEGVANLYKNDLFINEDYRKAEVRSRLRYGHYDGIVFSSHAYVTDDPRDSFLLTHDGRISLSELDDYIREREAPDQRLDLLVLSACETAQGDERAALGLAGVGIKAGAATVLATQWPVNDESTADLVTAFFSALGQSGKTKAMALQEAQRSLIASGRFNHPYYWAPFMLIGDWM